MFHRINVFICSCFFAFSSFSPISVQAAIEDPSVGSEELIQPQALKPWKLNFSCDRIDSSDLDNSRFSRQKLRYDQQNATLEGAFYFDPCAGEGAIATIGYTHLHLDWCANPFFSQRHFNTLTLGINGFSSRCPKWFWQGRIAANFDLNHGDLDHYTTFDTLLWGRYDLYGDDSIGFHIGFIGQTGMKLDRVYPVLGFDWQINPSWKMNAIFPLNISLVYAFSSHWNVGVGSRFFDARHRVGRNETLSRALFTYRTVGAETFLNYTDCDWLEANVHIGYEFTGRIKVANQYARRNTWFDVDGAPYFGAVAALKF